MNIKGLLDSKRFAYGSAAVALLLLFVALLWPAPRPADPFADRARLNAAVVEAIRANPEIVVEALQAMQERQGQMEQMRARQSIAANRAALEQDANSVVGGNPNGDVTLVEFYDYRCPYCREAHRVVRDLLKADPNIRFVYKEFPILGPESMIAARAAVAARSSAHYEAFHDALMIAQSPITEDLVLKIAGGLGINVSALQLEMRSPDIEKILGANHALAQQLGINGTPAFVIGDTLVPGAVTVAELQKLIASQRAMAR